MKEIREYHYFNEELIEADDRIAKLEKYLVNSLLAQSLLDLDMTDEPRESSIVFEIKHHHSTAQLARILARKRNLPLDVCTAGALLHDVYVIKKGKLKEHAHLGVQIAEKILRDIGGFSEEEIEDILRVVNNHSDKHIWTDDPIDEFGKDVDVLDLFLYPGSLGQYLKNNPLYIFNQYIVRAKKIWEELNLPEEKAFKILDNYNENWFNFNVSISEKNLKAMLKNQNMPSFCFKFAGNNFKLYSNKKNCEKIIDKAKDNATNIDKIIELSKGKGNIIMVWNAIDSYEVLNMDTSANRIRELGINFGEI